MNALEDRLRSWLRPFSVEQRAYRLAAVMAAAFVVGLACCAGMLYAGLREHWAVWPLLALNTAIIAGLLNVGRFTRRWLTAFTRHDLYPPSCTSDPSTWHITKEMAEHLRGTRYIQ